MIYSENINHGCRLFYYLCCCLWLTAARVEAENSTKGSQQAFDLLSFDLMVTAFQHEDELSGPEVALRDKVISIATFNELFRRSYEKYGDVFHYHHVPDAEFSCLEAATCYLNHVSTLQQKHWQELLPNGFFPPESDIKALTEILEKKTLATVLTNRLKRFVSALPKANVSEIRGNKSSKKVVYVLQSDHILELEQENSISKFLSLHPQEILFKYVKKKDNKELFHLVGDRWQAGAFYNDALAKDILTVEQWEEWLLGEATSLQQAEPGFLSLPIADAHVHVLSDGYENWHRIMKQNGVHSSANAALPKNLEYQELATANDLVLSRSPQQPLELLPFSMLSPNDKEIVQHFKDYRTKGMRGLKLINGHGDYFVSSHQAIIDPPGLRAVFKLCEKQKIPVLWHVNTHLYSKGFLRTLRDFPKLVIVNPHFGGYLTYAPSIVRQLLKTYPNLYFDLSLGVDPVYLRRSFEDLSDRHQEWRQLFIDFSDRFLFGIDFVVTKTTSPAHARLLYRLYRSLLEKKSFPFYFFGAEGGNYFYEKSHYTPKLNGLALPEDVLKKIYWDNAARLYGMKLPAIKD